MVIDRAVQIGKRLPLPVEGDERPFRDWLKSRLLVEVLGWPDESIKIGERFDILLLDEFDHPVVTVETKAPYHRSTKMILCHVHLALPVKLWEDTGDVVSMEPPELMKHIPLSRQKQRKK
jgi:hypothetical protein